MAINLPSPDPSDASTSSSTAGGRVQAASSSRRRSGSSKEVANVPHIVRVTILGLAGVTVAKSRDHDAPVSEARPEAAMAKAKAKSFPSLRTASRQKAGGAGKATGPEPGTVMYPPPPSKMRAVVTFSRSNTVRGMSLLSEPLSPSPTQDVAPAPGKPEDDQASSINLNGTMSSPKNTGKESTDDGNTVVTLPTTSETEPSVAMGNALGGGNEESERYIAVWGHDPIHRTVGSTVEFVTELRKAVSKKKKKKKRNNGDDDSQSIATAASSMFAPKSFEVTIAMASDDGDGVNGKVALPIGVANLAISGDECIKGRSLKLDLPVLSLAQARPLVGVEGRTSNIDDFPIITVAPNEKSEVEEAGDGKHDDDKKLGKKKKKRFFGRIFHGKKSKAKVTEPEKADGPWVPSADEWAGFLSRYGIDAAGDAILRVSLEVYEKGSELENHFLYRHKLRQERLHLHTPAVASVEDALPPREEENLTADNNDNYRKEGEMLLFRELEERGGHEETHVEKEGPQTPLRNNKLSPPTKALVDDDDFSHDDDEGNSSCSEFSGDGEGTEYTDDDYTQSTYGHRGDSLSAYTDGTESQTYYTWGTNITGGTDDYTLSFNRTEGMDREAATEQRKGQSEQERAMSRSRRGKIRSVKELAAVLQCRADIVQESFSCRADTTKVRGDEYDEDSVTLTRDQSTTMGHILDKMGIEKLGAMRKTSIGRALLGSETIRTAIDEEDDYVAPKGQKEETPDVVSAAKELKPPTKDASVSVSDAESVEVEVSMDGSFTTFIDRSNDAHRERDEDFNQFLPSPVLAKENSVAKVRTSGSQEIPIPNEIKEKINSALAVASAASPRNRRQSGASPGRALLLHSPPSAGGSGDDDSRERSRAELARSRTQSKEKEAKTKVDGVLKEDGDHGKVSMMRTITDVLTCRVPPTPMDDQIEMQYDRSSQKNPGAPPVLIHHRSTLSVGELTQNTHELNIESNRERLALYRMQYAADADTRRATDVVAGKLPMPVAFGGDGLCMSKPLSAPQTGPLYDPGVHSMLESVASEEDYFAEYQEFMAQPTQSASHSITRGEQYDVDEQDESTGNDKYSIAAGGDDPKQAVVDLLME